MVSVRKIQHPEFRVYLVADRMPARKTVKISLSKLRFAVGKKILIAPIAF